MIALMMILMMLVKTNERTYVDDDDDGDDGDDGDDIDDDYN